MVHQMKNLYVFSVLHCVQGAFDASSRGTPKLKNGVPRDEHFPVSSATFCCFPVFCSMPRVDPHVPHILRTEYEENWDDGLCQGWIWVHAYMSRCAIRITAC